LYKHKSAFFSHSKGVYVSKKKIWEKKKKKKITGVNFRDKLRFGWRSHRESFQLDNTYVYIPAYTFYQHIMFRHSCGECHYTNLRRTADITLADFWGWEK
jgi:hypothetical protein